MQVKSVLASKVLVRREEIHAIVKDDFDAYVHDSLA